MQTCYRCYNLVIKSLKCFAFYCLLANTNSGKRWSAVSTTTMSVFQHWIQLTLNNMQYSYNRATKFLTCWLIIGMRVISVFFFYILVKFFTDVGILILPRWCFGYLKNNLISLSSYLNRTLQTTVPFLFNSHSLSKGQSVYVSCLNWTR